MQVKQHAQGFEDFLQSPLQPLMDNLESCTYEVFEKDPIKYTEYKRAIHRALQERITDEEAKTRTLVLMVLGAGRGIPVDAFQWDIDYGYPVIWDKVFKVLRP